MLLARNSTKPTPELTLSYKGDAKYFSSRKPASLTLFLLPSTSSAKQQGSTLTLGVWSAQFLSRWKRAHSENGNLPARKTSPLVGVHSLAGSLPPSAVNHRPPFHQSGTSRAIRRLKCRFFLRSHTNHFVGIALTPGLSRLRLNIFYYECSDLCGTSSRWPPPSTPQFHVQRCRELYRPSLTHFWSPCNKTSRIFSFVRKSTHFFPELCSIHMLEHREV